MDTRAFFTPPDAIWAQCGIQFRVRSVKRIVETDPEVLHLRKDAGIQGLNNDGTYPGQFCGSGFNGAFMRDAAARWDTALGLDGALPGIQVYMVPRINRVMPSSDFGTNTCLSVVAFADDGFAMLPAVHNDDIPANTLYHELGHTLGLRDLDFAETCTTEDPALSNVMCQGFQTGHHVMGCNAWRQDAAPGHNCVALEAETPANNMCATARASAKAIAGTQPNGPVGCPSSFFSDLNAPSGMMNLNSMSDLAAFGGKELKLNDRARLLATSSSYDTGPFSTGATLGTSRIGVEAKLKTLATTGSRADFTYRYTIQSIFAGDTTLLTAQDGRDLVPLTTRGAALPNLWVDANFPNIRTADIVLEPGQAFPTSSSYILLPGSYVGNVVLKRDSVLRLGAGRYFFDNLDVQTGGILEVDHRAGHVEIYVRQNFSFTGAFRNKGGSSYANLVVYSGTGTAQILQAFTGTLLATRGSINLENFVHQGAFYAARKLELHQGGAIRYRPLVCTP